VTPPSDTLRQAERKASAAAKALAQRDLRQEVEKRKQWFYECQLRGWNVEAFRSFTVEDTYKGQAVFEGLDGLGKWTRAELNRRDRFSKEASGDDGDWLGYKHPVELIAKLSDYKTLFLASLASHEPPEYEARHPYRPREMPNDDDALFHGVSRLELSALKPWILEQLFGWTPGEIVNSTRAEYQDLFPLVFDGQLRGLSSVAARQRAMVSIALLDEKKKWSVRCGTSGRPPRPLTANPGDPNGTFAPKAIYWLKLLDNPLREVFTLKANSDMGLTHIVRVLYRYGTLPLTFPRESIRWRKRVFDDQQQAILLAALEARSAGLVKSEKARLAREYAELAALLHENAADLHACDLRFSLLAEEVARHTLLRYKFWIDEPFKVLDPNLDEDEGHDPEVAAFNEARKANLDPEGGYKSDEMEFWSENHYLMFASAEYLLGQLWPQHEFQPAMDFLGEGRREFGRLNGEKRRLRGRTRVLRYLTNRLAIGWTEWNSAGYYREHFEALSNLVDFALDEEVTQKARMALDLLYFDLARFTHQGSFGAAAGRAQFKTKRSGSDQAVADIIELAQGTRGLFKDRDSAPGGIAATTSYEIPEVLLEIAAHPPATAFVDRSRVSIAFDESARFGIGWSMSDDRKESRERGYAEQLALYSPDRLALEAALAEHHFDYGKYEDDTVFWWTTSAYFSKQIILATKKLAKRWGLGETKAFKALEKLFGLGFAVSAVGKSLGYGAATLAFGPVGFAAAAYEFGNPFSTEQHADDLSVLVEGSIRTRANLYTYRCPEGMLSSVQNFRVGQFNFQSNHNQATLSAELSAFTTTPYQGVHPELLEYAKALGWSLLGPAGAIYGVSSMELDTGKDLADIRDNDDGPGWWTGYWANPLIVQHAGASILIYDFHFMQKELATCATHLWLPRAGLTDFEWARPNRDNFEDTQNFVEDALEGRNGSWIFARLQHPVPPESGEEPAESYLGVFSNQPLDTLDAGANFYRHLIEEKFAGEQQKIAQVASHIEYVEHIIEHLRERLEDASGVGSAGMQLIDAELPALIQSGLSREALTNELEGYPSAMFRRRADDILDVVFWSRDRNDSQAQKAALEEALGEALDDVGSFLAGQDHYAEGKNIIIVQVGGRGEFGSYENFKQQLRNTHIEVDDSGDMECSYQIPGDSGATLEVNYADREFKVAGRSYEVDRYPRFENPFVRGGLVEWQQREYTIEYRGKSLTHRASHVRPEAPLRLENVPALDADLDYITALALNIRTRNESMESFTVARANVRKNNDVIARNVVVAVGDVDEDTEHDVEWIYFDEPVLLVPDLGIELAHHALRGASSREPDWRMSLRIRALTRSNLLMDCRHTLSSSPLAEKTGESLIADYGAIQIHESHYELNFEDENRQSGLIPFSVSLDRWHLARPVGMAPGLASLTIASRPAGFRPHVYFAALTDAGEVRTRRVSPRPKLDGSWETLPGRFTAAARLTVVEPEPDYVLMLLADGGRVSTVIKGPDEAWDGVVWRPMPVRVTGLFGFLRTVTVGAQGIVAEQVSPTELILWTIGTDQRLYRGQWAPYEERVSWSTWSTPAAMSLSQATRIIAVNGVIYLQDAAGALWAGGYARSGEATWVWDRLDNVPAAPQLASGTPLAAACVDGALCMVFVVSRANEVWCIEHFLGFPPTWVPIAPAEEGASNAFVDLNATSWLPDRLHVFALRADGELFTRRWERAPGWDAQPEWTPLTRGELAVRAARVWPICRTVGTVEVFYQDEQDVIQLRWWS
jgi:hypothetical protein